MMTLRDLKVSKGIGMIMKTVNTDLTNNYTMCLIQGWEEEKCVLCVYVVGVGAGGSKEC